MIHNSPEHPVGALRMDLGGHSLLKGNSVYTMQILTELYYQKMLWAAIAWTALGIGVAYTAGCSFAQAAKKVTAFVLGMMALLWLIAPAPVVYKNTPVQAQLMDEQWTQPEKSGKHSYRDQSYLMYMTPDGPVSFRRTPGQVYPKNATLYKN